MPKRIVGSDAPSRCYHIVNRTAGPLNTFPFDETDRAELFSAILKSAELHTVRVVSVVVMSDHYHIVCAAPPAKPGPEEIKQHWWAYYSTNPQYLKIQGEPDWNDPAVIESWADRLWRVSHFVQVFQLRFSRWYNKRHERRGSIWMNRFRPVILEEGRVVGECTRYVELNPLRAGVCRRIEDYSTSTWGVYAATGAHPFAESAAHYLRPYVAHRLPQIDAASLDDAEVLAHMNTLLQEDVKSFPRSRKKSERPVLGTKFVLSPRWRSRYWSSGAVIGSEEFVRRTAAGLWGEEYARRKRLTPARYSVDDRPNAGIYSWRLLLTDDGDEDAPDQ